jgi:hypothetical protein
MENNMHHALVLSKVACYLFVIDFIVVAIACAVQLMPTHYLKPDIPTGKLIAEGPTLTPMLTSGLLIANIPPPTLLVLTYWQIIIPLKKGNMPRKSWSIILSALGYVFGLFVGGILLSLAHFEIRSNKG